MLLTVEPDGPVPIYQQIRDRIVEAIASGQQPAGSALPSTRQLAMDLGVNFHTVNKSYDILRQEGLVRINRKSGAVIRRDAGSGAPGTAWTEDWTAGWRRCSPRPPPRAWHRKRSCGTARPLSRPSPFRTAPMVSRKGGRDRWNAGRLKAVIPVR